MFLGVLQGGTRGLIRPAVVVLCEKIVRRRRKIWAQNRGEGVALEDFAVLFIRSRRFLAKSAACDRNGSARSAAFTAVSRDGYHEN